MVFDSCQERLREASFIRNEYRYQNRSAAIFSRSCIWKLLQLCSAVMENKCNKTPNSKYLDHVYCHTSDGKNYIRANAPSGNGGGGGGAVANSQDVMALLKENKQLKAMLIIHLDLIQEQGDQLMAKDKVLHSLREEIENLKSKSQRYEAQVQDLQKQLHRQMKRVLAVSEVSTLPPPPLAKIQTKMESELSVQISRPLDDIKYNIEESMVGDLENEKTNKKNYKIQEAISSSVDGSARKGNNIIGECNGKLISKIILQRVNADGACSPSSVASDSASEMGDSIRSIGNADNKSASVDSKDEFENDLEDESEDSDDGRTDNKRQRRKEELLMAIPCEPRSCNEASNMLSADRVHTPPSTTSRGGKQMPVMLSHAQEMHSDDSVSCDSMGEADQRAESVISPTLSSSPKEDKHHAEVMTPLAHWQAYRTKTCRCGYISTSRLYSTREWEDEEFVCDNEFTTEDVDALKTHAPMLEIPKWVEKELCVSYCIEGTEDLTDEAFLKRHSKLEVDERRRKKWDVQQIREQRRIEKLKRRHCKDEMPNAPEQQSQYSFYPQPEAVQAICYLYDLPVQAFGEAIPKLSGQSNFVLPWLEYISTVNNPATFLTVITLAKDSPSCQSTQAQQQMSNSSFVFMKKRRRQQSSSGATAVRQRQTAVTSSTSAKAASTATHVNCTVTKN